MTVAPPSTLSVFSSEKFLPEDKEFLLKGDVFTEDALDMWVSYKIDKEVNPVKLRPHPHEFALYFDI